MESSALQKISNVSHTITQPCVLLTRLVKNSTLKALEVATNQAIQFNFPVSGVCVLCGKEGEVRQYDQTEYEILKKYLQGFSKLNLFCSSCFSVLEWITEREKEKFLINKEIETIVTVTALKRKRAKVSALHIKTEVKEEVQDESADVAGDHCDTEKERSKEVKYTCPVNGCGKTYKFKWSVNSHHATVHKNDKAESCYFCDETFSTMYNLEQHMRAVHLIEKPFACLIEECGFRSAQRQVFRLHMRNNHTEEWEVYKKSLHPEQHKCPDCPKIYHKRASLWAHRQYHHTKSRKRYPCEICGKQFLSLGAVKEHAIMRHGKGNTYRCPVQGCKSTPFGSSLKLKTHMNAVHSHEEVLCEKCGCTFKNTAALKNHHRQNVDCLKKLSKNSIVFKCQNSNCQKKFTKEQMLKVHVEAAHKSTLSNKCQDCGAVFQGMKLLGKHMLDNHNGVPCPICNKRYTNFTQMFNHKSWMHSERSREKKFHCEWKGCKGAFALEFQLKCHVRLVHEISRFIECYFCMSRFSRKRKLQEHMGRQHLNERPYSCHEKKCGFGTATLDGLKRHLRQVHGRNPI